MYVPYIQIALGKKIKCVHTTFYIFNFITVTFWVQTFTQTVKNIMLFKTMKTIQIYPFWIFEELQVFEESRMYNIRVYCTNQEILNVDTNGTYDYCNDTVRWPVILLMLAYCLVSQQDRIEASLTSRTRIFAMRKMCTQQALSHGLPCIRLTLNCPMILLKLAYRRVSRQDKTEVSLIRLHSTVDVGLQENIISAVNLKQQNIFKKGKKAGKAVL